MDRKQKAKQIEKLLSKLLFDKRNIKIDVEPISNAEHKSGEYASWRKYVLKIHVDPYKFNDITNSFSQEYYEFMIDVEDIVSANVKYIGVDKYELSTIFVIDDKDEFIKMMDKIINDKWKEIELEYQIETKKNLPELDEILIRPKGKDYPEFSVSIGLKHELYGFYYKTFWNVLHEKLPIGEMFVQIV